MYTIRKGDTLWEISRKFEGVSLNDIMKLNGFTKNTKIMPGRKIRIKPA
jgi:membrane-bound lytic murein transglycosylase D